MKLGHKPNINISAHTHKDHQILVPYERSKQTMPGKRNLKICQYWRSYWKSALKGSLNGRVGIAILKGLKIWGSNSNVGKGLYFYYFRSDRSLEPTGLLCTGYHSSSLGIKNPCVALIIHTQLAPMLTMSTGITLQ